MTGGNGRGGIAAKRSSAGFTLVELLVVVFIMALIAGVAVASSGNGAEIALEMAEIQVRDALGRAQALARSNRAPYGVVFDVETDRFAIVDEHGVLAVDPLTRGDYIIDFVKPNQPKLVDIDSADFGAAGNAAIFDGQGVPLAGGTVTLKLRNSVRTLSLDAATGQVTLD